MREESPRILIRVRGRCFRKLREDDGPHRANGDGGNGGANAGHARTRPQLRLTGKRSGGAGVMHVRKRHHRAEACQALRDGAAARARQTEQKTLLFRDLSGALASN